jgi:Acyl-coenzyme A:6-aminopenicillanic acid acyl-transferase
MNLDEDLDQSRKTTRRGGFKILLASLLVLPTTGWGLHAWVNRDRSPKISQTAPSFGSQRQLAPCLFQLEISGEAYGLGHQHGQLLKAEVREVVRFMTKDLLGGGLLGNTKRDLMLREAWKLDAHIPDRFRQEMKGLAEGAGVDYADVLLINCFDDLQHLVGCSSAVVLGDGKEPLRHARNLDYPIPFLAKHKLLMDLNTHGLRLRVMGFPGFIGALTGMSDRGLGLSSHTSTSHRTGVGIPTGILYRMALEEGRDLQSMKAIIAKGPRTIGNNLALSDAKGNQALALEFDAEELLSREPKGGRLFVTNHFQNESLQPHQPSGWWMPNSGSQARVACLAESLPEKGKIDAETLKSAMGRRGSTRAWRTPSNNGTVQAVIMEPATGKLWIAKGSKAPVTSEGYVEMPGVW